MKDKKQLPQIIILGVMVAICAGYVFVKATAKKPAVAPPAPAAQAQNAPAAAADAESVATQPAEGKMVVSAVPAGMTHSVKRDPFAPSFSQSTTGMAAAPPPPGPAMNVKIAQSEMLPPWLPPLGVGPSVQPRGGTSETAANKAPVEEQFPAFQVTGVITGRTNVAIVRLGEEKFIVSEGQMISGKFRVVTVSQDGILLSSGGRSVFLKLGAEVNAS